MGKEEEGGNAEREVSNGTTSRAPRLPTLEKVPIM